MEGGKYRQTAQLLGGLRPNAGLGIKPAPPGLSLQREAKELQPSPEVVLDAQKRGNKRAQKLMHAGGPFN